MRIGIELNGVLRNTIDKFEKTYKKFLIDKTDGIDEESFNYEIKLPVKSLNLKEYFTFQSDEEYYSFLYEEFPMEIFGHAQSSEYSSFNDLNDFYLAFRDNNNILIVSDEIGKSKPASLFFLSKFGCQIENIKFYSNFTIKSMWNEIDILLTANPELLLNKPDNKIVIKYKASYNEEINSEFEIEHIKELKNKINQILEIYDVENNERALLP
jgi:hypothetical protein